MESRIIEYQVDENFDVEASDTRFHIDEPGQGQEITDILAVRGWVIHRVHRILQVELLSPQDEIVANAPVDIYRPAIHLGFRDYCVSDACGFELLVDSPAPGAYSLVAACESGEKLPLSTLVISPLVRPKIFFMHIAKAAGSSVNHFLSGHYPEELRAMHVESNPAWHHDIEYIRKLDFISGHIKIIHFAEKLDPEEYYKITLVREPYSHLISHLAWIRKLSDRGEKVRLRQHEKFIQRFSRKLSKIDLSKPREIEKLINSLEDKEMQLVDNCQTRYFIDIAPGKAVDDQDTGRAIKATETFDHIGITETTRQFLSEIARKMRWNEPRIPIAENVARSYYGLDISDQKIRAALQPLVKHDIELYEFVKHRTPH